jgi:hypothetical protein
MRKLGTVILLSLALIYPPFLVAREVEAFNQFHLDVDLKVKLFSTMLQVNQQLLRHHDELEALNLTPLEFDRRYSEQFKTITENYIQTQLNHGTASPEQVSTVSRLMAGLNWNRLSQIFHSTYGSMRLFTRTHGVGLMAAVILANIIQYSLGYALVLAGQPVLALTLTQMPTTPPTIFAHHVISNAKMKKRMTTLLGSPEAYQDYLKMKKDVLAHLHLHHANDVFAPINHASSSAVVLNQSTIFTKIAQFFNLASDKLTLSTLRSFLRSKNIEDPILVTLLRDSSISEYARMTMALQYMEDNLSGEQFALFKHQFSKNFVNVELPNEQFEKLHQWIKQAILSKSKNDLEFVIRNAPMDVHPQHVFESWEKIILPELARGQQLSYQDIRQLAARFHSIKIENEMRSEPMSSNSMRQTLNEYFRSSLNARSSQCFRSQQEIILQLLKSN